MIRTNWGGSRLAAVLGAIGLVLAAMTAPAAQAENAPTSGVHAIATESPGLPLAAIALSGPIPVDLLRGPCNGGCVECGAPDRIAASVTNEPYAYWLYFVSCQEPAVGHTCDDPALVCDEPNEEAEDGEVVPLSQAVATAVTEGDMERLGMLALKHSDWLTLIPERSAVQMRGCNGIDVARHWSIPDTTFAALTEYVEGTP